MLARKIDPFDASDEAWKRAEERFQIVSRFRERRLISVVADEACEELGISRSTLFRARRRVREAEAGIVDLVYDKTGYPKGRSRLAPDTEQRLSAVIREVFEVGEKPKLSKACKIINAIFESEGRPALNVKTVISRIKARDQQEAMRRREGPKKARERFRPHPTGMAETSLLDEVEIDHAKVDVFVVDEDSRQAIMTRPWVTMLVETASRAILGYHLSWENPSARSVSAALAHAVLPKDAWLARLGISGLYPMQGLMKVLRSDNAKEFKSVKFQRALRQYQVDPQLRRKRRPEDGPFIESLIGTTMQEIHLLPGTTKSNVKDRGDYDSGKGARLSFSELERWFALYVIGDYHNSVHSGLKMTPLAKWQQLAAANPQKIRMPANPEVFHISFLPEVDRVIAKDGINLHGLDYYDAYLNRFIGDKKTYRIKYDPLDVTRVWFRPNETDWHPIRLARLDFPLCTLAELQAAKRLVALRGRQTVDTNLLRETIMQRRQIVIDADRATKRARVDAARLKQAGVVSSGPGKSTPSQPIDFDDIAVDPDELQTEPWEPGGK